MGSEALSQTNRTDLHPYPLSCEILSFAFPGYLPMRICTRKGMSVDANPSSSDVVEHQSTLHEITLKLVCIFNSFRMHLIEFFANACKLHSKAVLQAYFYTSTKTLTPSGSSFGSLRLRTGFFRHAPAAARCLAKVRLVAVVHLPIGSCMRLTTNIASDTDLQPGAGKDSPTGANNTFAPFLVSDSASITFHAA